MTERNKVFERVLADIRDPLRTRQLAPALPEETADATATLQRLGLTAAEVGREVERIAQLTIGDCLLEASAWNLLAECADSAREKIRAGLLLARVYRSCVLAEATGCDGAQQANLA